MGYPPKMKEESVPEGVASQGMFAETGCSCPGGIVGSTPQVATVYIATTAHNTSQEFGTS